MGDRDYLHYGFDGGGHRTSPFWATHRGTKGAIVLLAALHLVFAILARANYDAYNAIYRQLALSPEGLLSGKIWQLVTYALMHSVGGIWHILINCLMLWWFGQMVESRLGTKRFLYFTLAGAAIGGVAYVAWQLAAGRAGYVIGASGAAMALLILGTFWYPTTQLLFMFVIRMPLWIGAAILVGMDVLRALAGSDSGIAFQAHLGGALWGWIYYRYGPRIEGVFARIDKAADAAQRKKDRRREEQNRDLKLEVDRILDKVNRDGMTALTDEEKKFLKSASKKLSG